MPEQLAELSNPNNDAARSLGLAPRARRLLWSAHLPFEPSFSARSLGKTTMKITNIRYFVAGDLRNFLFVVVETDTGIRGIGEAGVTWREAATSGFIDTLKRNLIGQDPMRTAHLWQVMSRGGFFPARGVGAAAISAIDTALWDIKGKALGVPLYQLLGGLVRDKVVCYTHIGGDLTQIVTEAKAKVAKGWRFVRFDLPETGKLLEPAAAIRGAVARAAAVREAVGPEIEMLIDVHTRLDPSDAITLCRELERFRMYFIEDPVRSEDFDALRRVREATTLPLAMGEQHDSKWNMRPLIEHKLVDYCRVDLCNVGGITEAIKIAGWCETHYIKCAPHNPLGPISTAACLHFDLATPNFGVQELPFAPMTFFKDLFPTQVPFDQGHLLVPTLPGLGVELDESAIAKYPPLADFERHLVREDGSFTNW
jgi:L-alanine-DL-glutamate epimerase-like enolase superfamily enzyme